MKTHHPLRERLQYSPVWQIVMARVRESYRRPETIFWVYVFPILMVVSLGVAFRNQPIERVAVDVEAGPHAPAVMETLRKNERMDAEVYAAPKCQTRLRTGRTDIVVTVEGGETPQYTYYYDPTKPKSVVARDFVDNLLQRAAGRTDPVSVANVELDEPGGRYIDFLVPGLLGMSLMGGGLWGVGFATVDMRIRKLLKRLVATPMRKSHFLLGVMLSRLFFMVPEVILLLGFSRYVFGVVIHGRLLAVVALILMGAGTFAGIGLLVASRAQTLEAVSGLMNLVMLPMWVLSGIFFSSERFPDFAQPLIKLLPLTPLINALRNVILEGASLTAQGPELAILTGWAVIAFSLALWWFRWT